MSALFDRGSLRTIRFRDGTNRSYWTGQDWQLGTARYWESVVEQTPKPETFQLGSTLRREIGACVVGGFGMTWETIEPYLKRLEQAGVLEDDALPAIEDVEALLREPVLVAGSRRRYRFPRQRAVRLCGALAFLATIDCDTLGDRDLRDALIAAPGIGRKTASWIVRNSRASDEVAIIDVHVARAGVVAGVFDPRWRIDRDYLLFEEAFIAWSRASKLSAARLDAVIWAALSGAGPWSRQILGSLGEGHDLRAVWSSPFDVTVPQI